ncbi:MULTISPECIES: hypothetical protein [Rothia]|uniref:hypothetical protein n=1 Tax=Rothia TaxID=32207 RepID=UPI0015D69C3A|nr:MULTISPECIES: hypothetical protein [Rothia]
MLSIVDLVLYAVIVGLVAILLAAYASDGWAKLEKKSAEALHRDMAFGAGG